MRSKYFVKESIFADRRYRKLEIIHSLMPVKAHARPSYLLLRHFMQDSGNFRDFLIVHFIVQNLNKLQLRYFKSQGHRNP